MKTNFLTVIGTAVSLTASTARGATIYHNTALSGAASGLIASQRTVQIDDVLIPAVRNPSNLPIAINSITLGLQALPGNTGEFSLYLYPVQSDGSPSPNPTLIATTSITFSSFFQPVTFGGGTSRLLTVAPDFRAQPGFGLFYIGLEARAISSANWVWADGPDTNLPTGYLNNLTTGMIFPDTSPGPPFPPHLSFYVEIDGQPVPEPSQIFLSLFLAGGAWALSGRRRKPPR